jgi:hypothetical protein
MLSTLTRLLNWVAIMMVLLTAGYLSVTFADVLNSWVVIGILTSGTMIGFGHHRFVASPSPNEDSDA